MILEVCFLIFLIASDLISKELISAFLHTMPDETYVVLDKIFTLQYTENTGASFSLFAGNQTALIVITSVIMVLIAAFLIWQKKSPKLFRYAMLMILGGGIGNLYDRIAFNYVRDFIDYTFLKTFFNIDFAIGNIADIYLCVGILMIIVYVIFAFKEEDFCFKKTKMIKRNE